MELRRLQDDGRKSKGEILGKLNSVLSENENICLENAKLKVISSSSVESRGLFLLRAPLLKFVLLLS